MRKVKSLTFLIHDEPGITDFDIMTESQLILAQFRSLREIPHSFSFSLSLRLFTVLWIL